MSERVNHATEGFNEAAACAVNLMHHYGFDLSDCTLSQLLTDWQKHYPSAWIRLATIEALYQGRYKAISVEQILAMWQRRSQPIHHFSHEFERLVCANLPEQMGATVLTQNESVPPSATVAPKPWHPAAAVQLPRFAGSTVPEADVMLALRTLHSEEMAALTEAALNKAAQTEVTPSAEADSQRSTQTYSYTLQANEPPSHADERCETSDQGEVNQPIGSVEQPEAEGLVPSPPEASDAALLDESIAPPSPLPEHEPPLATNQTTDPPAPLVLPTKVAPERSSLSQVGSIAKILQQLEDQELKAKALLPALGLLTPPLKPKLQLHLTAHYQPVWLTDPTHKQPIHQFTPTSELSDFYSKLKAVAQPPEDKTPP